MTVDKTFQFARKRLVPLAYDRERYKMAIHAIKRVRTLKLRREQRFYAQRMKLAGGKQREYRNALRQIKSGIDMIVAPQVRRKMLENQEETVRKQQEERAMDTEQQQTVDKSGWVDHKQGELPVMAEGDDLPMGTTQMQIEKKDTQLKRACAKEKRVLDIGTVKGECRGCKDGRSWSAGCQKCQTHFCYKCFDQHVAKAKDDKKKERGYHVNDIVMVRDGGDKWRKGRVVKPAHRLHNMDKPFVWVEGWNRPYQYEQIKRPGEDAKTVSNLSLIKSVILKDKNELFTETGEVKRNKKIRKDHIQCPDCKGSGIRPGFKLLKCIRCRGERCIEGSAEKACTKCLGVNKSTNQFSKLDCKTCNNTGKEMTKKEKLKKAVQKQASGGYKAPTVDYNQYPFEGDVITPANQGHPKPGEKKSKKKAKRLAAKMTGGIPAAAMKKKRKGAKKKTKKKKTNAKKKSAKSATL